MVLPRAAVGVEGITCNALLPDGVLELIGPIEPWEVRKQHEGRFGIRFWHGGVPCTVGHGHEVTRVMPLGRACFVPARVGTPQLVVPLRTP